MVKQWMGKTSIEFYKYQELDKNTLIGRTKKCVSSESELYIIRYLKKQRLSWKKPKVTITKK